MKVHPAADSFPMMSAARYAELRADIEAQGQLEPITLCDGMILDGRNRYKACKELGLTPATRTFDGDPWAFAWSLNGQRRDLVDEQRYLIWKHCNANSDAWQAQRLAIEDAANRKRSEKQAGVPKAQARERAPTDRRRSSEPRTKAAAAASKTNRGAVARGDRLAKERPDLAEAVRKGDIKPAEAHRQMKRDEVTKRTCALPDGKYRVIYADPPWQYNDAKAFDGASGIGAASHYPTMATSDLCVMPVKDLAADDAVLFCWATFPMLPDALKVVEAWGFKYKTAFVWNKLRPGFGNYHDASAELLLVATRGSGVPDSDARERQVQDMKREGRHSEKPERFRQLIDSLYPTGARIELFRRGDVPKGWTVWGNEAV